MCVLLALDKICTALFDTLWMAAGTFVVPSNPCKLHAFWLLGVA